MDVQLEVEGFKTEVSWQGGGRISVVCPKREYFQFPPCEGRMNLSCNDPMDLHAHVNLLHYPI